MALSYGASATEVAMNLKYEAPEPDVVVSRVSELLLQFVAAPTVQVEKWYTTNNTV